ncbi:MAG: hypothetical protein QXS54_02610 [Candidatus Methanomethylicaceae archaeon]
MAEVKVEYFEYGSPELVCNELNRLTADLYYLASQLALAARRQADAKTRLETIEASLYLIFSDEAKTVEKTKAKVKSSREWIEASNAFNEASVEFVEMKEKMRALEHRIQALMEIARVMRSEINVTRQV